MLFITSFKDNGTNSVKTKSLIKEFKLLSRITKFTESHYFMPYYIQQLEARGLQGDFILVEGMRTGSALVKARIKDRAYKVWISVKKKIKFTSFLYYLACKYSPLTVSFESVVLSVKEVISPSVKIIVIANLIISPAEAYILKHATIKYAVKQIKQSSMLGKENSVINICNMHTVSLILIYAIHKQMYYCHWNTEHVLAVIKIL